ncbi:DNA-directed RNA polymerase subunit beta [Candidatus Saccharibacteria bacterium]|nr:DNA-directed RNA polymerase subunit beta [Candidatus Saccharibacteria bacterium]
MLERKYFAEDKQAVEIPDLIQHQKDSWKELVESGLQEVFDEVSPIEDYTGQKFTLRFKNYYFGEPEQSDRVAREKEMTYTAPLHVNVELTNKVTGEVSTKDLYFGEYPWMTDRASFVVNGTEKVVVSQLVRSNGVFFSSTVVGGRNLYGAKLIPGRGAWLELETAAGGAIYAKVDRKKKIAVTTLLRAMGLETNGDIKQAFSHLDAEGMEYIDATIEKDVTTTASEAYLDIFRRLRPGDHATVANAKSLFDRTFKDPRRYDYSKVGRYKLNRRLDLNVDNTPDNRVLLLSDVIAIITEVIRLGVTQAAADDIDSLSNRRVRLVGELVARQFRIGMMRLQRNVLDRMSMVEVETATPAAIINPRPVALAVREFFFSSQLCQMMDETNPFAELSHKRRLNSMGPGGLTKERAGLEVRDAHPTHYGRVCLIETPEGGSIGLVLNLATYARVNEHGFIETPYRKVMNGKVTSEIVYLDADGEKRAVIAGGGAKLNKDGTFAEERVSARDYGDIGMVDVSEVQYIDAANDQVLGVSAAMIPFVERNRVDRALTGSSMQKQAVPLIKPESCTVGTGVEPVIARNTGQLVLAEEDGTVEKADGESVTVKYKKASKTYELIHFMKSNDDRSINQKVRVARGQKVKKGDVLIEGASIADGELALGRNLLVAFMPWRGYNMDDALVISRRLVEDDTLTSVNIKDYDVEIRDTKLGPELVTRDIPNASEHSLRHLDEQGIVRVGADVEVGDVLVGRITPKGEQELSSEERLLRAIFGEKAKDVKDTSQRMTNAAKGKVIGVKVFSKDDGYELKTDVLMKIKIYVAEMRKISVGDKMAGRHGNKGVVAKVLPVEDMPYMEDGTPIDVVLSPMGVPSRMNLGQLFETHLGMAAKALGYKAATLAFDGVTSDKISDELEKAGYPRDGRVKLYDGLTGEAFDEPVTVGVMHMIKLHHMVSDKIHARSTGPYTMVTQQPLGGKAQNGGQRFGEMEVWALEAYGAASILQEILTIKSDDVFGRSKAYEAIIKDEPIGAPKLPEGFNVLVKELQGLGLKVDLLSHGNIVEPELQSQYRPSRPRRLDQEIQEKIAETQAAPPEDAEAIDQEGVSVEDVDALESAEEAAKMEVENEGGEN